MRRSHTAAPHEIGLQTLLYGGGWKVEGKGWKVEVCGYAGRLLPSTLYLLPSTFCPFSIIIHNASRTRNGRLDIAADAEFYVAGARDRDIRLFAF